MSGRRLGRDRWIACRPPAPTCPHPFYGTRLPFGRCALGEAAHEAHVFTRAFTVATDPIPDVMQQQTLWCPGGAA